MVTEIHASEPQNVPLALEDEELDWLDEWSPCGAGESALAEIPTSTEKRIKQNILCLLPDNAVLLDTAVCSNSQGRATAENYSEVLDIKNLLLLITIPRLCI